MSKIKSYILEFSSFFISRPVFASKGFEIMANRARRPAIPDHLQSLVTAVITKKSVLRRSGSQSSLSTTATSEDPNLLAN